jgi:hypothetical protein
MKFSPNACAVPLSLILYTGIVFADSVPATIETNILTNSGALPVKSGATKSKVPMGDSDKFNLVKELANPVANLISIPFQCDTDMHSCGVDI